MQNSNFIEVKSAEDGAAYKALYEHYMPSNCGSRQRQKQILAGFAEIKTWLKGEDVKTRKAYTWAMGVMEKQIALQIKGLLISEEIAAIEGTFPKPPTWQIPDPILPPEPAPEG